MRKRQIEPFFLVIRDDDQKVAAVEGPMTDDRSLTDLVYEAQTAGRQVRCSSGRSNPEDSVRHLKALGYEIVPASHIVLKQFLD